MQGGDLLTEHIGVQVAVSGCAVRRRAGSDRREGELLLSGVVVRHRQRPAEPVAGVQHQVADEHQVAVM